MQSPSNLFALVSLISILVHSFQNTMSNEEFFMLLLFTVYLSEQNRQRSLQRMMLFVAAYIRMRNLQMQQAAVPFLQMLITIERYGLFTDNTTISTFITMPISIPAKTLILTIGISIIEYPETRLTIFVQSCTAI